MEEEDDFEARAKKFDAEFAETIETADAIAWGVAAYWIIFAIVIIAIFIIGAIRQI